MYKNGLAKPMIYQTKIKIYPDGSTVLTVYKKYKVYRGSAEKESLDVDVLDNSYNVSLYSGEKTDEHLMEAIELVIEAGQASTSFIQRRFNVGYARAGRIIDQMEERGVISGYQGSKPREVLMTMDRWNELKMGNEN